MTTTNRIEHVNGTAQKEKPKAKGSAPKRSRSGKFARKNDHLREWAMAGVVMMAALSAVLNGYAHADHAPNVYAGWGMGLVVPALVLVIFKVAGSGYHRGYVRFAWAMGAVGAGILTLSLYHCSLSIAALTGSPWFLAVPMAVAIDCGLVGCEIAILLDD